MLACVAEIVVLPAPTIVIVRVVLSIVATAAFELVYVKAPVLFEVGALITKDASPITFTGTETHVIDGAIVAVAKFT